MWRRGWNQEWRLVIKFKKAQPSAKNNRCVWGDSGFLFIQGASGHPFKSQSQASPEWLRCQPHFPTTLNETANPSDKDWVSFLPTLPPLLLNLPPYLSNNHLFIHRCLELTYFLDGNQVCQQREVIYNHVFRLSKSLGKVSVPCQVCFKSTIEAPWARKCFRHSLRLCFLPIARLHGSWLN